MRYEMDLCKRIHTLILVLSLSHGLRLKSNTISQTQMAADKKHFFDWMAHAHNLSKGAEPNTERTATDATSVVNLRHNNVLTSPAQTLH